MIAAAARFRGRDDTRLAFRELGEGRTLILTHGITADSREHWLEPGHAERLARLGYRVVMPDLRGHGESEWPRDRASYPKDVFVDDLLALIDHLGEEEFDLGGYSLGSRTALRAAVRGARPGRLVLGGLGLTGMVEANGPRNDLYRRVLTGFGGFDPDTREGRLEAHIRATGLDPIALFGGLEASLDTPRSDLAQVTAPTLATAGAEDGFHSATVAELAAILPAGSSRLVPGNHLTSVLRPELGEAFAEFLGPACS